jgi:hypothetical protein
LSRPYANHRGAAPGLGELRESGMIDSFASHDGLDPQHTDRLTITPDRCIGGQTAIAMPPMRTLSHNNYPEISLYYPGSAIYFPVNLYFFPVFCHIYLFDKHFLYATMYRRLSDDTGETQMRTQTTENIALSGHCQVRLQQRGLKTRDMDLMMEFAEEVDDGYIMTNKARVNAIAELRRKLQRVERLGGVAFITNNGVAITTYRADRHRVRDLCEGRTTGSRKVSFNT